MTTITTKAQGTDRVIKILKKIPEANFNAAKKAFSVAAFGAHEEITKNASGGTLQRRTGTLARGFTVGVQGGNIANLKGEVASSSIYAPIQEYGGTIRATSAYRRVPGGPYLNIPTSFNKTAAGVQRQSARSVFMQGGHIVQSKRGNYVVMLNGMPMFSLVKRVTIPARLGMRKAGKNQIRPLLDTLAQIHEQELRK